MALADVVGPLAVLTALIGSLLVAYGIGELLWGGRGSTGPPDWWGRLDSPVPEPSPAPALAGVGGFGSLRLPPPALLNEGSPSYPRGSDPSPADDGRPDSPQNLGPASYQAIVLAPAGKWGSYWQETARCHHRHPLIDQALRCGLAEHRPYITDGGEQILAVGVAE